MTETELVASICRESFYEFVREFWSVIVPEEPEWNWHIKYLCDKFQESAERVFAGLPKETDTIVNISPGTTKSTIFSIMGPAWIWSRMASARIIGGSYAHNLALELSRKGRQIVLSEKYRDCFPEIVLSEDQNTKAYYANTKGGTRYAVGVGGSVIGMHAHFIIVDDPIDPLGVTSEEELKSSNTWMTETLPSRKVDKRVTVTWLIMQRLHQNDPTGHMLDKVRRNKKIQHICLPAELTANVSPPECEAYYVNGLMDPIRLNREVLEDQREELLEDGYSCQYLQDPVPRGGALFKVDRLVLSTDPFPKMAFIVRYWDKASTVGGGAFTVGTKIGRGVDGRFYIMDVKRGQWGVDEREDKIVATAKFDRKKVRIRIEEEPGSGGKESAQMTVRKLAGYKARADRPSGNKELRAEPFADQMNAGNVVVPANAPWLAEWIKEFRYFPRSRYKDQVDSGSGAFAHCSVPRRRVGALGRGRRAGRGGIALAAAILAAEVAGAAVASLLQWFWPCW